MTDTKELRERLLAACVGHPHAKIPWPHRILHEAASAIERLEAERDETRLLVSEANNSLYGSQGYFHSLNGGAFDRYHLATGIESLKASSRAEWRRAEAAEAQRDQLAEALRGMVARFELYAGPNDMHAGHHDIALLARARAALASLEGKPNV